MDRGETTVLLRGKTHELTFSFSSHYGTNDRREEGESLDAIVDSAGRLHPARTYWEKWEEVFPGVRTRLVRTELRGGSRVILTRKTQVRIGRAACPVELRARRFCDYTSEHHNESRSEPYIVRVLAGPR